MAETRFIRTVTFGGYDKTDVDKRLEYLYSQVYELKNELRETKLSLDKYKKGTEEEKLHESVLAGERAKLTEVQVKNETMSERIKAAEDDNKTKEKELVSLRESNAEMEKTIADMSEKLSFYESGGDASSLSTIFIEAQKSATMLVENAKKQAADIESDSKKLAENMITEANNRAAVIVYDAEKYAAEMTADTMNKAEQMEVASGNMKAAMLKDVEKISAEVTKLKQALKQFASSGYSTLEKSEKIIETTRRELNNGGVPVFKVPESYEPDLPEAPKLKPTDYSYASSSGKSAPAKKKNSELDRLQAMADAIGGGESKKESGGVSLAELAKQAEALESGKNKKKSGGISLSDLAKQAEALNK